VRYGRQNDRFPAKRLAFGARRAIIVNKIGTKARRGIELHFAHS